MTSQDASTAPATAAPDAVPFRYTPALAGEIEVRWQDEWERRGTFFAANPSGELTDGEGRHAAPTAAPFFVMDMFPYPSGAGLHIGHPLGYIATDVVARFHRMQGDNVLHALGFDAFGLPAEQYAVQTGQHPRTTTEANIAIMQRQLRRLGLAHDPRRTFATIDPDYVRWTQWIFLRVFDSWYDEDAVRPDGGRGRARPVAELEAELAAGTRAVPVVDGVPQGVAWDELDAVQRRRVVDAQRLAYVSETPVNWCPGLGTVLANEEVTADGRSERGNFPVFQRSLRQWNMRITAYADRLADDLEHIDWPEKVRAMQRNWIGRSTGARVRFHVEGGDEVEVFTTRPDTLFGATFMVVAPEHPLLDAVPAQWPDGTHGAWTGGHRTPAEAVAAYRAGLDEPAHRLAVPVQRAELDVPGVGVRVEVDQRHPAEPVVPGHPGGVGQGDGVVAAEHDRDRPGGGDRVHGGLQCGQRAFDVAGEHLHVARVVHAQVPQAVDAQRQRRAGAVVRQVAGLPDGGRAEPGAGPVRGAAVEGRADDHHVRVGVGDRLLQGAGRYAEKRDVGAVHRAVTGHRSSIPQGEP